MVHKKELNLRALWFTIIPITLILFASYNAFSYDLFNYIFDAKILTEYHENPYQHKALDYPEDPMLSFMRWTHRTYPYGPTWLGVTAPLSFVGLGIFLPTFYLFKMLMAASFLGTVYFIQKIVRKTKFTSPEFAVAFFALNPLVLIESLVSAHNDIVMMFVTMASIYFLIDKRYIGSGLLFIFAGFMKYATFFLAPAYAFYLYTKKTRQFFMISIVLMIIAVILATYRTNFQPWYLLFVLPIAALVSDKKYIVIPTIIISFGVLLRYIPFLYAGNWDPPIPQINANILIGSLIIAAAVTGLVYLRDRKA